MYVELREFKILVNKVLNMFEFKEQLSLELKDLKDIEQQMKPMRIKTLSDLLISVSKAERQEARMKVCQDSLRLGNVGVIRLAGSFEVVSGGIQKLVLLGNDEHYVH
ncbi:hypothetical protein ACH5RR_021320 [Cinchona calisaya]|uniref:Uncharacterized protein n=1 Tax=Cinchona calisaya TaxID=153742 RepID=A0ABD2ZGZ3_9GENT